MLCVEDHVTLPMVTCWSHLGLTVQYMMLFLVFILYCIQK